MVAVSDHWQVRACLQRGAARWCTAWGADSRVAIVPP
jgi:hypothetical protein